MTKTNTLNSDQKKLLSQISKTLAPYATAARKKQSMYFFKTGVGQYSEHDIFIGVSTPHTRLVAKQFQNASQEIIATLLKSKIHEERYLALEILVMQYEALTDMQHKERKNIFDFYLQNTEGINNWDLVDCSASYIVGHFVFHYPKYKTVIKKLAKSKVMWEKRISIVALLYFTSQGTQPALDFVFETAEKLLGEKHDLMHKAVGWVLREAGKKDEARLKNFLKTNYEKLPRTTLRYAIERFKPEERLRFLKGKF